MVDAVKSLMEKVLQLHHEYESVCGEPYRELLDSLMYTIISLLVIWEGINKMQTKLVAWTKNYVSYSFKPNLIQTALLTHPSFIL